VERPPHDAKLISFVSRDSDGAAISAIADLIAEATPLARGVELNYKATARGDCTAEGVVSGEEIARMRLELAEAGKTNVDVALTLTDETDTTAIEGMVRWHVRLNKKS